MSRLVAGLSPALTSLLAEIGDAKRIRVAGADGSAADRAFLRGWSRLLAGEPVEDVARSEAAAAVAGARLAGLDAAALQRIGAPVVEVLLRAYDAVATVLPDAGDLRKHLGPSPVDLVSPPWFATALCAQPRAGATAPGVRRTIVEPPESHGDHCWAVAVYAVLLAPLVGADAGEAYLLGLGHHLHNAVMPDAGFAGEVLLGDALEPILTRLEDEQLATLPASLAERLAAVLALRPAAQHPVAQAFHAADVLDRVLQVHHHARAAAFTTAVALEDLDIVHAGPVQAFHLDVLAAAGLR